MRLLDEPRRPRTPRRGALARASAGRYTEGEDLPRRRTPRCRDRLRLDVLQRQSASDGGRSRDDGRPGGRPETGVPGARAGRRVRYAHRAGDGGSDLRPGRHCIRPSRAGLAARLPDGLPKPARQGPRVGPLFGCAFRLGWRCSGAVATKEENGARVRDGKTIGGAILHKGLELGNPEVGDEAWGWSSASGPERRRITSPRFSSGGTGLSAVRLSPAPTTPSCAPRRLLAQTTDERIQGILSASYSRSSCPRGTILARSS